jgi:uncharacterized protein (TIGR02270 family)
MPIILEVLEQHTEEAAFLWVLRDSAVYEPHYALSDLSKLDNRLDAHIDGLRIAGGPGWEICKEALAWEEAGEIFTAGVLAFESGIEERIQVVLEAVGDNYELSRGLISVLGWIPFQQIESHALKFIEDESSALRGIGLAAYSVHRQDPGKPLTNSLTDSDIALRARALRSVGELGRKDLVLFLKDHLNEENENCRYFAARSAAIFGDASAIPVLRSIAVNGGAHAEKSCALALRTMALPDSLEWLRELAQEPDHKRLAVTGYGVLGDPMSVSWLIQMMAVPELARAAGESFTMITGVDIAYEDLEGEWSEGFEAGPTESPEDEDVEMDPDEDLSWPEPELISEWWNKNKNNFRNSTRYLCGKPINEEQCQHVLRYGYQRKRAAAAIELAIMNPGQSLFEIRAPGFRQQRLLGLK